MVRTAGTSAEIAEKCGMLQRGLSPIYATLGGAPGPLLNRQHRGKTWAGAGQQSTRSMGFMETSRKRRLPSLPRHAGTMVRLFSDRLSAVRFVSWSSFGIPG